MKSTLRKHLHDGAIMLCTTIFVFAVCVAVTAPVSVSSTGFTAVAVVWAIATFIGMIVLLAKREDDSLGKRIALALIKWA